MEDIGTEDNILTYLKWRGDLSLVQDKFNDVDGLILAELSYVPFEEIFGDSIAIESLEQDMSVLTIKQAGEMVKGDVYSKIQREYNELAILATQLLLELAQVKRFQDMKLSHYVNKLDYKTVEQFSAIHIELSDVETFIAFRGTADEMVGWKEDFNMSYMMPVPAQETAVAYMNITMNQNENTCRSGNRNDKKRRYRVGGHSKGGNLAIYGSVFCKPDYQSQIERVYSFDGPGFNEKMLTNELYHHMEQRIVSYVPQSSIVGMLFKHLDRYKVVQSTQTGIRQHNILSWNVNNRGLVLVGARDNTSYTVDATLHSWIGKMDQTQRKQFIEVVFEVLDQAGIHNMSDITTFHMGRIPEIIRAMNTISPEDRKMAGYVLSLLFKEGERNIMKNIAERKSK